MDPWAAIDLRARCSRYFTWADLIECGETFARLRASGHAVPNLPMRDETWEGLAALARDLLDPLHERFGAVTLTYGFAGPALTRHVPARIAPSLDQHAGAERSARGTSVCSRGGQACDLCVPGVSAVDVAAWVRASTPFDRIYLYGPDRPLHVSASKTPARRVYAMRRGGRGLVPLDVTTRTDEALHTLW